MLRWSRVHSSRIAVIAVSSLFAAGVATVSPHEDDCHDAACSAIAVEHDAADHHFTASAVDKNDHALHCTIHHLIRIFRLRSKARISPASADTGATVHTDFFAILVTASDTRPPLRGPPASPLT